MKKNFKTSKLVKLTTISTVLILILITARCTSEEAILNDDPVDPSQTEQSTSLLKAGGGAEWSYDGDTGPEFWGELDHEYLMCSEGMSQSPINLDTEHIDEGNGSEIHFEYLPSLLKVVNNGHTIKATPEIGSFILLNGKHYDLLQFHFHAPSEHTKDNEFFPIEVHFVHSSSAGELLVLGVFFERGEKNKQYEKIWKNLPLHKEDSYQTTIAINLRTLLPEDVTTMRYSGSLTTPPCSEGVKWNVFVENFEMSNSQISAFQAIYDHNNRPIQPLNGREVKEYEND